ncbi:MAG: methyl-accepting chemotaxis protein [Cyanobacteria bacterium P01_F01_bin.86]
MTQTPSEVTSQNSINFSDSYVPGGQKNRHGESTRSSNGLMASSNLPQTKPGSDARIYRGVQLKSSPTSGITLRKQLLRTFLPLSLAPLAIASAIGYYIVDRNTEQQTQERLTDASVIMRDAASQLVDDGRRIPLAIADNPYILNSVRAASNKAEAEQLIQAPIEQLEQQFDATHLLEVKPELNDYLVQTAENEGLAEIHITERNGFVISYSSKTSDFVQSDEEWWQTGRQNTQWIMDPEVDESVNTYAVDFLQAIVDPNTGEFLGLIQAVLPAAHFNRLSQLFEIELTGSRQLQLVDASSGTVVNTITPEGPSTTQDITGGEALQKAITELAAAVRSGQSPEPALQSLTKEYAFQQLEIKPVESGNGDQSLVVAFNYQGQRYSLTALSNIDWVAIASIDVAEIRAAGRNIAIIFLIVAVPLAGIALFIALWLADQLSIPLKQLSRTAEEVSKGNLEAIAIPAGTAETQILAQIFNNLVESVKRFLQEQTHATDRARLLAEITGARAESNRDLPSVFNRVVEGARLIIGSDRVTFYRFNHDGSGQIVAESVADKWPRASDERNRQFLIPEELMARYRTGHPVALPRVAEAELPVTYQQLMDYLQTQASLVVPVFTGDRLLGLLMADHCSAPYQWESSEIEFLEQLAGQLGLVIDRVTLFEETEALADEQQTLKENLQRRALELLKEVDPISQGNLTIRARVTEDEIGTIADSYNATVDSLRRIVLQVQEATSKVSATTNSNDAYIQELSQEAARQATEIADALVQIQMMAEAMREVATSAEYADAAVQEANQTAREGDEAMNRTVEGIQAIRVTVAETAKKVKHLGESSQKISTVVDLIGTFAAQTNMLALNASIEASRAGEEGRGFAVVAGEVRALAQQSAEATEEIRKLVTSIQSETNEVVTAMEAGTEQVVAGTQLVDETRQSLNKITAASATISQLVETIAQVTVEQSQTSELVSATMTDVAEAADKTSTEARQVSSSFEGLRRVADTLQESVGRFKVG